LFPLLHTATVFFFRTRERRGTEPHAFFISPGCLRPSHVLRNVLPRGNAAQLHPPPAAPTTQPLKLALPSPQRRRRGAVRRPLAAEQVQETTARGSYALGEILLRDTRVQCGRVEEAASCGKSQCFCARPWCPNPCSAVFARAALPPQLHLFQEHLTRAWRHLVPMHMLQICSGSARVPVSASTQGTQGAPLCCTARGGCPRACRPCGRASTQLPQLRCDSMHRLFQHCVFSLQP